MPTYSAAQLADAMRRAGFPESEIATGVAVATAESGRRSEATNRGTKQTPEYSVGPWQINLNAHGSAISEDAARDLDAGTAYAYRLWKSSGWRPWSVYLNGSYRQHLGDAPVAGSGGNVEPTGGRSASAAAEYEARTKADIDRAAAAVAEMHDPQWRADYIARKQHDPAFRAAAAKKYAGKYTDPDDEEAWDAAAKMADDELRGEEARRQSAYEKAKDDYRSALGGATRDAVQQADLALKLAQLDKALNPPGPQRTPEQRDRDIAAAREAIARVNVAIPAQAARDIAGADLADAQRRKIERELIPDQIRVLQEGLQTVAHIRDQIANGSLQPEEAEQYFTSVQRFVEAGLRGSTPAEEEAERQKQITERAQIGRDLLNTQVQTTGRLAGELTSSYQQMLSKMLEPPSAYDPLQAASLLGFGSSGGLAGDMGTQEIAQLLISGLAPGAQAQQAPVMAGQTPGLFEVPGVTPASLVGPNGESAPETNGLDILDEDLE